MPPRPLTPLNGTRSGQFSLSPDTHMLEVRRINPGNPDNPVIPDSALPPRVLAMWDEADQLGQPWSPSEAHDGIVGIAGIVSLPLGQFDCLCSHTSHAGAKVGQMIPTNPAFPTAQGGRHRGGSPMTVGSTLGVSLVQACTARLRLRSPSITICVLPGLPLAISIGRCLN